MENISANGMGILAFKIFEDGTLLDKSCVP